MARARTNTERGRASRLRAAARVRALSRAESRWLAAYDRAVTALRGKRAAEPSRDTRRKRRPKKGSARNDAIRLVMAFARWAGGATDDVHAWWERKPLPGRPGSASAAVKVRLRFPPSSDADAFADLITELDYPTLPQETGRAAAVKARIKVPELGDRPVWLSLASLTTVWNASTKVRGFRGQKGLAREAIDRLYDILARYNATMLLGFSVYVTGAKY